MPFVLADVLRCKQFQLIGHSQRFWKACITYSDANGVAWAAVQVDNAAFGITWLGPGWVFDSYARSKRSNEVAAHDRAMRQADDTQHEDQLMRAVAQFRFGQHAERLLWAIHVQALASRSSVFRVPDRWLARLLWGDVQRPTHWRTDIRDILRSLCWLHVANWPENGRPAFGEDSVLLIHVGDLRGTKNDCCDNGCPERTGGRHHHYLVNIGRGFLGILEEFAEVKNGGGIRSYTFPIGSHRSSGPTLRRVGRSGRLMSVYIPAKLGKPTAIQQLSGREHRMLQAIVRETTRKKKRRRGHAEPDVVCGNQVPDIRGQGLLDCPLLRRDASSIGFNGNKRRKGLGYRLLTAGGWLTKGGYVPGEVDLFLGDLGRLTNLLGLQVAGLDPITGQWFVLAKLQALAHNQASRATLDRLHVRMYATSGYLERWNAFFGWSNVPSPSADLAAANSTIVELSSTIAEKRLSLRAVALQLGVDPSFLSKIVRQRKSCPTDLLNRIQEWIARKRIEPQGRSRGSLNRRPRLAKRDSIPAVALAYREQGLSVLPQEPGTKRPTVRWKRYQEELPSVECLEAWFRRWPDAGLVVVLGPVSNLLAVDVDGSEAHKVLIEELGQEPLAPKVLSGSGQANRYHLFFRHPNMPTKAKAVPWHPKLEFRGHGGIIVLPPSLHQSGNRYAWAPNQSLDDLQLPELPEPIRLALSPRSSAPKKAKALSQAGGIDASLSTREFLAGRWAQGPEWNDRIFRAACDLAGRGHALEKAKQLLLNGASPWNQQQEHIALRTIESAYSQPREAGRL